MDGADFTHATEVVAALSGVQQRIVGSFVLSALLKRQHLLNVVSGLQLARTGARVSYATSLSIADARAVLAVMAVTLGQYFGPLLIGLRAARPAYELLSRVTSAIPRTHHLVDLGLDLVRQRPGPSGAVLEGLLLGETAPHREERSRIVQPTLVVGHPRDPVHPFSDSGMLAEELPNAELIEAESIFEWRLTPRRLDDDGLRQHAERAAEESHHRQTHRADHPR